MPESTSNWGLTTSVRGSSPRAPTPRYDTKEAKRRGSGRKRYEGADGPTATGQGGRRTGGGVLGDRDWTTTSTRTRSRSLAIGKPCYGLAMSKPPGR